MNTNFEEIFQVTTKSYRIHKSFIYTQYFPSQLLKLLPIKTCCEANEHAIVMPLHVDVLKGSALRK